MQVITDPLTGRSKGYGFVRFGNEAERDRSLTEMSGHIINSRPIRVSVATAKKSQSSAVVRDPTLHLISIWQLQSVQHLSWAMQGPRESHSCATVRAGSPPARAMRSSGLAMLLSLEHYTAKPVQTDHSGHVYVLLLDACIFIPLICLCFWQAGGANAQPHPSDYDPTNTTLFIGGLSSSVTEEDLRILFGRYGDIVYTKIPPGKGCGFVQFVQRPAAEAAMGQMQVRSCW